MKSGLISVIIPVYNVENYLARCLDSIINQTYKNLEILCINDGSTDNSLKILKQFQLLDSRIRIISHNNRGLSYTRNVGIEISTGEYISFIDSDDWIDLNFYEKAVNNLINFNADICFGNMQDAPLNTFKTVDNDFKVLDFSKKIELCKNGSVCDKLYKRELFEANNLRFIEGKFYEDNIVTLKLMFFSKIVITDKSINYYYFRNENSICRNKNTDYEKKRNIDRIFMVKEIFNFFNNKTSMSEKKCIKEFITRTVFTSIRNFNFKLVRVLGFGFIIKYFLVKIYNKIFNKQKKL